MYTRKVRKFYDRVNRAKVLFEKKNDGSLNEGSVK